MAIQSAEHPLFAKQLSEMFGVHTEGAIRAMMCRARNPLPCVKSGGRRPHRRAYPSVYRAMLDYEMGVAGYAEVEQAARRVLMGALQ